jgi:hypothetical protein
VDNELVPFSGFSVKTIYKSILQAQTFTNKAIVKWDTHFNEPIHWHEMIKYINHGYLLENKTKEKLYKIYTRAIPVGRKMKGPNASTSCPFCLMFEDEMHCFVQCRRVVLIWKHIKSLLALTCHWTSNLNDKEQLFGYVYSQRSNPFLQVWKVMHAETIRVIWYSQCHKLYDNEVMHFEEIKARVHFRIQFSVSLLEASTTSRKSSRLRLWKQTLPHTIKNRRLKLDFSNA